MDKAYYWYSLAIRFGSPHARKNRADISGGLQAARKSEIEKMAAAWLPMG